MFVQSALRVAGGILGALVILGGVAWGATLSWTPPNLYTDNTAISAADKAAAVYTPGIGTSSTGPWTAQPNTPPGATSATVPNPTIGQTRWYSVRVTINGQPSAWATPGVSLSTPFPVPGVPFNLTISP